MSMVKTAELTGTLLDWAVAKIEQQDVLVGKGLWVAPKGEDEWYTLYAPSTLWTQGGPIIEREKIELRYCGYDHPPFWAAATFSRAKTRRGAVGPTALIAAMRVFVASKLGNEVEIPEELI